MGFSITPTKSLRFRRGVKSNQEVRWALESWLQARAWFTCPTFAGQVGVDFAHGAPNLSVGHPLFRLKTQQAFQRRSMAGLIKSEGVRFLAAEKSGVEVFKHQPLLLVGGAFALLRFCAHDQLQGACIATSFWAGKGTLDPLGAPPVARRHPLQIT